MKRLFKKKQQEFNEQLKLLGKFEWIIFAVVNLLLIK